MRSFNAFRLPAAPSKQPESPCRVSHPVLDGPAEGRARARGGNFVAGGKITSTVSPASGGHFPLPPCADPFGRPAPWSAEYHSHTCDFAAVRVAGAVESVVSVC